VFEHEVLIVAMDLFREIAELNLEGHSGEGQVHVLGEAVDSAVEKVSSELEVEVVLVLGVFDGVNVVWS
jgi:hypothetical protein